VVDLSHKRRFGRKTVEEVDEHWQVAQGQRDGKPIITRFDRSAGRLVGSRRYGIHVGVAVPLIAATDDGLPGPDELPVLDVVEDTISRAVLGKAVLVGVITTAGMREFVLYTGSADWIGEFDQQLNSVIEGREIQVMAQRDPAWDVYRAFVPE
jgi:Family of unknown function (DUF695)